MSLIRELKKKKKPRWMESPLDKIQRKQRVLVRIFLVLTILQIGAVVLAAAAGERLPWFWILLWG